MCSFPPEPLEIKEDLEEKKSEQLDTTVSCY
jgi:hypothetical protein